MMRILAVIVLVLSAAALFLGYRSEWFSSPIKITASVPTCEPASIALKADFRGDADSDGLPDSLEKKYGTAVNRADTDYDGYSDCDEIINKSFGAGDVNLKFNPLISDLPVIDVELVSLPEIEVLWSDSTITSVSSGRERSRERARSQTKTSGGAYTTSAEASVTSTISGSITTEANVSLTDISAGVSATIGFSDERTKTVGSSSTVTWDETSTRENRNAFTMTVGRESSTGKAADRGRMTVSAKLINSGDVAVTLEDISLSVFMLEPESNQLMPVGTLLPMDDGFKTVLAPGADVTLNVRDDNMSVAVTKSLLRDSRGLIISPSSMLMLDVEGKALTHSMTGVLTSTAQIIIDYGDVPPGGLEGGSVEEYRVALAHKAGEKVTVQNVFDDILKLPYTIEETYWCRIGEHDTGVCDDPATLDLGLNSIRAVANDSATTSYWAVTLARLDESDNTISEVGSWNILEGEPFNPSDVEIKARDILTLVYISDDDRDGLGNRIERMMGTNPRRPDTDYDGVSDYIETVGYVANVRSIMDLEPSRSAIWVDTRQPVEGLERVTLNPLTQSTRIPIIQSREISPRFNRDLSEYERYSIDQEGVPLDEAVALVYIGCNFEHPFFVFFAYPPDVARMSRDANGVPMLIDQVMPSLPQWNADMSMGSRRADGLQGNPIFLEHGYAYLVGALPPGNSFPDWSMRILPGYEFIEIDADSRTASRSFDADVQCSSTTNPAFGLYRYDDTAGVRRVDTE